MKLINETTGEVVREGLSPADVRALYDAGVRSLVGEDAQAGGGGAGQGETVPTDREFEQDSGASSAAGQEPTDEEDGDDATDDLADRIEDAIEEMEQADDERSSAEWHGVEDDEYDDADEAEQRRYDRLQERIDQKSTPIGERKTDRERKMGRAGWTHDRVRTKLRESGIADDVEEAFRKLKTQDEPTPSDDGDEIHIDGYIRHLAGDYTEDEFYLEQETVETGDRAVAVALDMSGSMDELKAKVAYGALWIATNAIGDELVGSAFYSSNPRTTPRTTLITAPGESFDWEHLDAIRTDDLTPTPSGIADAKTLLDATNQREKVMIVITDGQPNLTTGGQHRNTPAEHQTRDLVNQLRAEGTKVIGFGVEPVDASDMENIFGDNGYVMTSQDGMADALVDVYRRQMRTA